MCTRPERELAPAVAGPVGPDRRGCDAGQVFIGRSAREPRRRSGDRHLQITGRGGRSDGETEARMFARVGVVYERRCERAADSAHGHRRQRRPGHGFRREPGQGEQRDIKTGLANAGFIEVTEGLKQGEQVVVVGQNGLKTGNLVRVVTLEKERNRRNADVLARASHSGFSARPVTAPHPKANQPCNSSTSQRAAV